MVKLKGNKGIYIIYLHYSRIPGFRNFEATLHIMAQNSQIEQCLPDYIILIFQPQRVIYFFYSIKKLKIAPA